MGVENEIKANLSFQLSCSWSWSLSLAIRLTPLNLKIKLIDYLLDKVLTERHKEIKQEQNEDENKRKMKTTDIK